MVEKKVAIIGKAANSQMLAPYEDVSWEIWGLSNAYANIPRWDVWFELHDWEYHRRINPPHYHWLMQDHKKPIWTFEDNYNNAPCAKRFPIEQVMAMFGDLYNNTPSFRYWTNSPAYMMALAILQGATHIGMWGIDMCMSDEYAYQRPSCELMIGVCLAKGIRVTIPPESSLCKSRRLYGYETHNDDGYVEVRTRENALKEKIGAVTQEAAKLGHLCAMFEGALQELEVAKTMGATYNSDDRVQLLQNNLQQQQSIVMQMEQQKHIIQGALEDLTWVKTVFLT